jgi:predicted SnoaL-like aldol condensation-catalyzing enzyme
LERHWSDHYVQHNPHIANGHQAVRDLFASVSAGFKYEFGLIVEDGDFVMVHGRYTGVDPKPLIAVDIFRIEDGKLAEHWDVLQEEAPAAMTVSGLIWLKDASCMGSEQWAGTNRSPSDVERLFRNYRGEPLTRSGVAFLLDPYRRRAVSRSPTVARKGISPHSCRHPKAMHMLQAGIAPVTIKDILGHAHLKTLEAYVQADLEMKRRALEDTPTPINVGLIVQRHEPDILRWLEEL